MNEEQPHQEKPNTVIIFGYGLLIAATLCLFVPLLPVFVTGGLMLSFTWLMAVTLTFGKSPDHLVHNHMTYIARTISTWSTLSFVLACAAGILVSVKADNSVYNEMLNGRMNGIAYSMQESIDVMMNYIKINMGLMIVAGLMCLVPSAGYIAYRITRGLSNALKGQFIGNPKARF
jgi:hypothetical protein